QIRAQLAHAGAAIAGDRVYGGPPAPRLLLHASRIELAHPRWERPIAPSAPVPRAFDARMDGRAIELEDALELAAQRRFALGRAALREPATTAFRLLHEGGDGVPGVAVDVYGDWLVLHTMDPAIPEERLLDALDALGFAGVYV